MKFSETASGISETAQRFSETDVPFATCVKGAHFWVSITRDKAKKT